jgi:hypothetical protein
MKMEGKGWYVLPSCYDPNAGKEDEDEDEDDDESDEDDIIEEIIVEEAVEYGGRSKMHLASPHADVSANIAPVSDKADAAGCQRRWTERFGRWRRHR